MRLPDCRAQRKDRGDAERHFHPLRRRRARGHEFNRTDQGNGFPWCSALKGNRGSTGRVQRFGCKTEPFEPPASKRAKDTYDVFAAKPV